MMNDYTWIEIIDDECFYNNHPEEIQLYEDAKSMHQWMKDNNVKPSCKKLYKLNDSQAVIFRLTFAEYWDEWIIHHNQQAFEKDYNDYLNLQIRLKGPRRKHEKRI